MHAALGINEISCELRLWDVQCQNVEMFHILAKCSTRLYGDVSSFLLCSIILPRWVKMSHVEIVAWHLRFSRKIPQFVNSSLTISALFSMNSVFLFNLTKVTVCSHVNLSHSGDEIKSLHHSANNILVEAKLSHILVYISHFHLFVCIVLCMPIFFPFLRCCFSFACLKSTLNSLEKHTTERLSKRNNCVCWTIIDMHILNSIIHFLVHVHCASTRTHNIQFNNHNKKLSTLNFTPFFTSTRF